MSFHPHYSGFSFRQCPVSLLKEGKFTLLSAPCMRSNSSLGAHRSFATLSVQKLRTARLIIMRGAKTPIILVGFENKRLTSLDIIILPNNYSISSPLQHAECPWNNIWFWHARKLSFQSLGSRKIALLRVMSESISARNASATSQMLPFPKFRPFPERNPLFFEQTWKVIHSYRPFQWLLIERREYATELSKSDTLIIGDCFDGCRMSSFELSQISFFTCAFVFHQANLDELRFGAFRPQQLFSKRWRV